MSTTGVEGHLSRLVPLESYRSPWVPTKRLGTAALIGIANPLMRADGDISEIPSHWYAVDPSISAVIAFARTSIVTPVAEFRPAQITESVRRMHPREAHKILRENAPDIHGAFFSGTTLSAELRGAVATAYRTLIPAHLLAWLVACCGDFFVWLDVSFILPESDDDERNCAAGG